MTATVRITPQRERIVREGGKLDLAEIHLGGVPRGAVIVLCSEEQAEGDDEHVLNQLAAHGYEGLAATVRGSDWTLDRLKYVESLLERLAVRGWRPEQIGVIGYGIQSAAALQVSAGWGFGAAVAVSPTEMPAEAAHLARVLSDVVPRVDTPLLIMTGAQDPAFPPTTITTLEGVLRSRAQAYTEVVSYPGVTAHFYQRSTESLELAASFDYWQRTIEWLDARVEPRLTPLALAWRERRASAENSSPRR